MIFISVGYGPQKSYGQLQSMNFGPVNNEGGERRLNVLFSRARIRCEVFASFDPADLDLGRIKSKGPRVLKRFLEFAKTGVIEEIAPSEFDADSPFEEDVANVIGSLGYIADPQVGTAGFRIDIGVRHPDRPGQYIVAVECDGATYHGALWARERDRARQEILEHHAWRFHRIWSTDWFHHREREIKRLKIALEEARARAEDGIRVPGANSENNHTSVVEPSKHDENKYTNIESPILQAPAYIRADFKTDTDLAPHEVHIDRLAELVTRIVEVEGPIHEAEIARRVSSTFGLSRTGSRISDVVGRAIHLAVKAGENLTKQGSFVLTASQLENPPIRDRKDESGSLLKAEYLPPIEISAAAKHLEHECGAMLPEEMSRAVARLLGFQRVGPDLFEVITKALDS